LIAKVVELAQFPNKEEQQRIISGLRWIGLFDSKAQVEARGNLLDTLCATLERKMVSPVLSAYEVEYFHTYFNGFVAIREGRKGHGHITA